MLAFRYFDKTGAFVLVIISYCDFSAAAMSLCVLPAVVKPNRLKIQRTERQVLCPASCVCQPDSISAYGLRARGQPAEFITGLGAGTGYIKVDDLRKVLHNLGLGLSHRTAKELCLMVAEPSARRPEKVFYRELYEKEVRE